MDLTLKPNTLLSQKRIEDTINTFRKIVTCIIVVILTVIVFGQGFTQADAAIEKKSDGSNDIYTVATGGTTKTLESKNLKATTMGRVVLDLAYTVYGGFDSLGTGALTIDTSSTTYWQYAESAYDAISAVGAGLAFLWCLLELIEKSSSGHITGEFVLQLGIKFTIAAVVISEGGAVARGVINLANAITTDVVSGMGTGDGADALGAEFIKVYEEIEDANFFGCLGPMFSLVLPAVMVKVSTIIIWALLAGRLIEVAVRYIFFPIGASDVFSHGMGSPGFRYIKKLFGASLQGLAMYLVVQIGVALMASDASTLLGVDGTVAGPIFKVIVMFSTIGAMLKVSSIVNDIAG